MQANKNAFRKQFSQEKKLPKMFVKMQSLMYKNKDDDNN